MLMIISPSKTQDFSPSAYAQYTQPRHIKHTAELVTILKGKTQDEIAHLMKISEPLARLNFKRFQAFSMPFNLDNAKQALLAFKGDVYHGIDAPSLGEESLHFTQDHLRILSGLYGTLRPLDLIHPYRLEMGTKLVNGKGRNLYDFWGDKLSTLLNTDESEVIINLASNEYFKGINQKVLKPKMIHIIFKENKNGDYKTIGVYAKRARGLMARFVIKNQLKLADDLKNFDTEGYQFKPNISDRIRWVFTRD